MIGWGPRGVYFALQPADAGKGPSVATEVWVVDPASPGAAHRVGPNPPPPAPDPNEAIVPPFQSGTRPSGYAGVDACRRRKRRTDPLPGPADGPEGREPERLVHCPGRHESQHRGDRPAGPPHPPHQHQPEGRRPHDAAELRSSCEGAPRDDLSAAATSPAAHRRESDG